MAVSSGFFNSLKDSSGNPDRTYSADDLSKIFDGMIRDGVYEHVGDCFAVSAVDGEMAVLVASGRCWFNHTWLYNDSTYKIELEPAYDLLNRYDSIVIEVNTNSDVRATTIKVISGEGASEAVVPTLTNTNYIHQYRIADIYIAADTDSISDSNITYMVGTDETPYVTAPLEIVSSSEHWKQWYTELQNFVTEEESEFMTWFNNMKAVLNSSDAGRVDLMTWAEYLALPDTKLEDRVNRIITDINDRDEANSAKNYDASKTYSVGDIVLYNGFAFKCTSAITVNEDFNSDHWTQIYLGDEISQTNSKLTELETRSTTEKAVGTWIDGSTIYEQTVTVPLTVTAYNKRYRYQNQEILEGVKYIVSSEGFVTASDSTSEYYYDMHSSQISGDLTGTLASFVLVTNSTHKVHYGMDISNTNVPITSLTATLRYTKA